MAVTKEVSDLARRVLIHCAGDVDSRYRTWEASVKVRPGIGNS
ncbi:hypothetical protein T10_9680 [Trichinella papuae]|uniref:Uncharacterized protein n=1 Tax=Trichinella papuae TaxID=268474 RepID=A0A0V1MTA0_9BILA|nr:hypothetical protein T10_9680 [Trichinella papuae]